MSERERAREEISVLIEHWCDTGAQSLDQLNETMLPLLNRFALAERLEEHVLCCHKALLKYDVKGKLIGNLRCGEDWKCERLVDLERQLAEGEG